MKRYLHEIWKNEINEWKVQAPKGILTFKTKKEAKKYVNDFEKLRTN